MEKALVKCKGGCGRDVAQRGPHAQRCPDCREAQQAEPVTGTPTYEQRARDLVRLGRDVDKAKAAALRHRDQFEAARRDFRRQLAAYREMAALLARGVDAEPKPAPGQPAPRVVEMDVGAAIDTRGAVAVNGRPDAAELVRTARQIAS